MTIAFLPVRFIWTGRKQLNLAPAILQIDLSTAKKARPKGRADWREPGLTEMELAEGLSGKSKAPLQVRLFAKKLRPKDS